MHRQRVILLNIFLINIFVLALTAPRPVLAEATVRYAIPGNGSTTGDCLSWAEACTLTQAIAAAAAGDQVWVKTGTYKPGALRTDSFTLKEGVTIYGGFAGAETTITNRDWTTNITVLSGDIGTPGINTDNSYHVVYGTGLTSSTVLDGFTITRGNANGASFPLFYGGGMYMTSSSPILTNLSFTANNATFNGGGIYLNGCSPTLTSVTFIGNVARYGSGLNNNNSSPILTNVTFTANKATYFYGGAMYNTYNSSPQVRNSIVWGNTNGQVVDNDSTSVISYSDVQSSTPGAGNINAVPLFVRLPSPGADTTWGTSDDDYGDLRLQAMSPAINAGDNNVSSPALPAIDLAGQPRILYGIVDMGAFENLLPNHAPVLSGSFPNLSMIQDPVTFPETTVGSLLSGHVTDADGNAGDAGMAIYACDSTYGTWQYSLDDGTSWPVLENLSDTSALVLGPVARLRFIPAAGWNGRATLNFRAWDGTDLLPSGTSGLNVSANGRATPFSAEVGMLSAVVTSGADAPVFDPIGEKTVDEHATLTFTATAISPLDPPPTLTYSLDAGAPAGASIDPETGAFSWTPVEEQGPGIYFISVRVTDDGTSPASSCEIVQVTVGEVNEAPELGAIANKNVNEGTTLTFTATATDSDLPANTLTYSLGTGAPEGASINAMSGSFTWTPAEAHGPGIYSITVLVTDNSTPAQNDSETIQVTVGDVNTAPVLDAIGSKTGDELSLLTFFAAATDSDLPANTLTYSLDAGAPEGTNINATTGEFRWTPTEAQGPGVYLITVRVTDNGDPAKDDSETIQVTVGEVNADPVLGPVGNQNADEGQALAFILTATDPLDAPANNLSFSISGLPEGASYQLDKQSGAFAWTPSEADGPGTHILTITVTDDGYPAASDSETIQVTVGEVNVAPELVAIGNKTFDEETLLAFTATTLDADLPANALTYSLSNDAPEDASIDPATGAFSWTPTEAHGPGVYTFTITVTDSGAPALSDSETIQVTVNDVNVAPNGVADQYRANHGTFLTIPPSEGVLINDSDHELSPLTATLVDSPLHGLFMLYPDGAFEYLADPNFSGDSDSFTYQASDGMDASNIVTVTIFLNTLPVVDLGANQEINEGDTASFTALVTDPDGAPESWVANWDFNDGTTQTGGTTATHLYPDNGTFTVTATVADTYDALGTGRVQVRVNNVAPELHPVDNMQVQVGQSFNLAMYFTDPGVLDTHTVQITWEPGSTDKVDLTANLLNFSTMHTYAMFGTYNVLVRVMDKDGGADTYPLQIVVTPHRVMLPMAVKH